MQLDNNRDLINSMLIAERKYQPQPFYVQSTTWSEASPFLPPIQPDLDANMRRILFDWMSEVSQEFLLGKETVHLAYNYVVR